MPDITPPLLFFSAALAIIPIASLIVRATEQVAVRTGDAVGGLLNATFGNAPELIIALVALKAGYYDMVRASLIGAILANLLLALGVSFLLGGVRYHNQNFNPNISRVYSSMMLIAVLTGRSQCLQPLLFTGGYHSSGSIGKLWYGDFITGRLWSISFIYVKNPPGIF